MLGFMSVSVRPTNDIRWPFRRKIKINEVKSIHITFNKHRNLTQSKFVLLAFALYHIVQAKLI